MSKNTQESEQAQQKDQTTIENVLQKAAPKEHYFYKNQQQAFQKGLIHNYEQFSHQASKIGRKLKPPAADSQKPTQELFNLQSSLPFLIKPERLIAFNPNTQTKLYRCQFKDDFLEQDFLKISQQTFSQFIETITKNHQLPAIFQKSSQKVFAETFISKQISQQKEPNQAIPQLKCKLINLAEEKYGEFEKKNIENYLTQLKMCYQYKNYFINKSLFSSSSAKNACSRLKLMYFKMASKNQIKITEEQISNAVECLFLEPDKNVSEESNGKTNQNNVKQLKFETFMVKLIQKIKSSSYNQSIQAQYMCSIFLRLKPQLLNQSLIAKLIQEINNVLNVTPQEKLRNDKSHKIFIKLLQFTRLEYLLKSREKKQNKITQNKSLSYIEKYFKQLKQKRQQKIKSIQEKYSKSKHQNQQEKQNLQENQKLEQKNKQLQSLDQQFSFLKFQQTTSIPYILHLLNHLTPSICFQVQKSILQIFAQSLQSPNLNIFPELFLHLFILKKTIQTKTLPAKKQQTQNRSELPTKKQQTQDRSELEAGSSSEKKVEQKKSSSEQKVELKKNTQRTDDQNKKDFEEYQNLKKTYKFWFQFSDQLCKLCKVEEACQILNKIKDQELNQKQFEGLQIEFDKLWKNRVNQKLTARTQNQEQKKFLLQSVLKIISEENPQLKTLIERRNLLSQKAKQQNLAEVKQRLANTIKKLFVKNRVQGFFYAKTQDQSLNSILNKCLERTEHSNSQINAKENGEMREVSKDEDHKFLCIVGEYFPGKTLRQLIDHNWQGFEDNRIKLRLIQKLFYHQFLLQYLGFELHIPTLDNVIISSDTKNPDLNVNMLDFTTSTLFFGKQKDHPQNVNKNPQFLFQKSIIQEYFPFIFNSNHQNRTHQNQVKNLSFKPNRIKQILALSLFIICRRLDSFENIVKIQEKLKNMMEFGQTGGKSKEKNKENQQNKESKESQQISQRDKFFSLLQFLPKFYTDFLVVSKHKQNEKRKIYEEISYKNSNFYRIKEFQDFLEGNEISNEYLYSCFSSQLTGQHQSSDVLTWRKLYSIFFMRMTCEKTEQKMQILEAKSKAIQSSRLLSGLCKLLDYPISELEVGRSIPPQLFFAIRYDINFCYFAEKFPSGWFNCFEITDEQLRLEYDEEVICLLKNIKLEVTEKLCQLIENTNEGQTFSAMDQSHQDIKELPDKEILYEKLKSGGELLRYLIRYEKRAHIKEVTRKTLLPNYDSKGVGNDKQVEKNVQKCEFYETGQRNRTRQDLQNLIEELLGSLQIQ